MFENYKTVTRIKAEYDMWDTIEKVKRKYVTDSSVIFGEDGRFYQNASKAIPRFSESDLPAPIRLKAVLGTLFFRPFTSQIAFFQSSLFIRPMLTPQQIAQESNVVSNSINLNNTIIQHKETLERLGMLSISYMFRLMNQLDFEYHYVKEDNKNLDLYNVNPSLDDANPLVLPPSFSWKAQLKVYDHVVAFFDSIDPRVPKDKRPHCHHCFKCYQFVCKTMPKSMPNPRLITLNDVERGRIHESYVASDQSDEPHEEANSNIVTLAFIARSSSSFAQRAVTIHSSRSCS